MWNVQLISKDQYQYLAFALAIDCQLHIKKYHDLTSCDPFTNMV